MSLKVYPVRKSKKRAIKKMYDARESESKLDKKLRFLDSDNHRFVTSTRNPLAKLPKPGHHTVLSSPPVGEIVRREWNPNTHCFNPHLADSIDSQSLPDQWSETDAGTIRLWNSTPNQPIAGELKSDSYHYRHATSKDLQPWCKKRPYQSSTSVIRRFANHRMVSGLKRCPGSISTALSSPDGSENLVEFYQETRYIVYACPHFNNASWKYDLLVGIVRVQFFPPYYTGNSKVKIDYGTGHGWSDAQDFIQYASEVSRVPRLGD